jgi:hypothetical protein
MRMNVLRVLSAAGDTTYVWDRAAVEAHDAEAEAAVLEAERIFASARRGGATAFSVTDGVTTTRLDKFDRTAEQIILVPRIIGG